MTARICTTNAGASKLKRRSARKLAPYPSPDQLVYTPDEVRQILKIGVNHVSKLLLSGELKSVKLGDRTRRITRVALEDYLARMTAGKQGNDITAAGH